MTTERFASPDDDERADELVPVIEAKTEFEAKSLVVVLEAAGIRAVTFGSGDLPSVPSLTTGRPRGVAVQVARRDRAAAERILANLPREADEIDWDAVDVGEPTEETRPASFLSSPGFIRFAIMLLLIGGLLTVAGAALELFGRRG
jgi:hypothetical protein